MSQEVASAGAAYAAARVTGEILDIELSGTWTLTRPQPRADEVLRAFTEAPAVRRVAFETESLERWDSSLLIFLTAVQEFADERELTLDTQALPQQVPRLLTLARAVPERTRVVVAKRRPSIIELGQAARRAWDALMEGVTFVGEVALSASAILRRRAPMRWREFWVIAQMNSSSAMPIVTLIALLVGIIIAFLGVVVLQRFGAGYYVSYLIGFGVLREMGALMTAIILAGRTGAAFAAELGSMKITEEIDAFVTLGISPVEHLVVPRVLGIVVMMPLLTIYADLIGIIGGFAVSATMLDLSLVQFFNGLSSAVGLSDCLLGVAKGLIFGAIIGIAGCMRGLQTGSDASAVGRAATSAVVLGITGIILANAIIDWLAALLNV